MARDRVAAPRRAAAGRGIVVPTRATWREHGPHAPPRRPARSPSPPSSSSSRRTPGSGRSIDVDEYAYDPDRGHDRAAHADLLPRVRERRRAPRTRRSRTAGCSTRKRSPPPGRARSSIQGAGTYPYHCAFHPVRMQGVFRVRPIASDTRRGRRGPDHAPDRAGRDQDARTSTTSSDAATAASGRRSATAPASRRRPSRFTRAGEFEFRARSRDRVHRGPRRVVAAAEGDGPRGLEALEQDRALHLLDRLRHLDAARARVGAVEGRPASEDAGLLREDLRGARARPRRGCRR